MGKSRKKKNIKGGLKHTNKPFPVSFKGGLKHTNKYISYVLKGDCSTPTSISHMY